MKRVPLRFFAPEGYGFQVHLRVRKGDVVEGLPVHREPALRDADLPFPITVELRDDEILEDITIYVEAPGFWPVLAKTPSGGETLECPEILDEGPEGWWHRLHNASLASPGLGRSIRVGIVDASYPNPAVPVPAGMEHIEYVGLFDDFGRHPNEYGPQTVDHGYVVAALLARRVGRDELHFAGIAPEVCIVFASAGVLTSDGKVKIDSGSAADVIEYLAIEKKCDLISFSAGDEPNPQPSLETAARIARDEGALIVCAAGNQGGEPQFPARYDAYCSIAACGRMGAAPEVSNVTGLQPTDRAQWNSDLYLADFSARGPGVNAVAAGDGVLCDLRTGGKVPLRGTSYAAPIATGMLARLLADDDRFQSARGTLEAAARGWDVLEEHAAAGDWGPELVGFGLLCC